MSSHIGILVVKIRPTTKGLNHERRDVERRLERYDCHDDRDCEPNQSNRAIIEKKTAERQRTKRQP